MIFGLNSLINSENDINSCSKIIEESNKRGAIFIGNLICANNINELRNNSIKSILTFTSDNFFKLKNIETIEEHLIIKADDSSDFEISKSFEESFKFLDKCIKKGNVLIHCVSGISRSPTILIAFMMKRYKKSLDEIFRIVKKKRNVINPNQGFMSQLKKFEKSLKL